MKDKKIKNNKTYLKIVCLLLITVFYNFSFAVTCMLVFSKNDKSPKVIQVLREAGAKHYKLTFSQAAKEYTKKDKEIILNEIIEILKPAVKAGNTQAALLTHKVYQDLRRNEDARQIIDQAINSLDKSNLAPNKNKDVSSLYMRQAEMHIRKAESTKDYRSIVKKLEEAGELGNPLAYETLALWHLHGKENIPKNLLKSHIYFQKYHYYERYKHPTIKKNDVSNGSAKAYLYNYYKDQKSNEQGSHLFFKEIISLKKELASMSKLTADLKKEKPNMYQIAYALEKTILAQLVLIAAHDTIISLGRDKEAEVRKIESQFFKMIHDNRSQGDIFQRHDIVKPLNRIISYLEKETIHKNIESLAKNMKKTKINEKILAINTDVRIAIANWIEHQYKVEKQNVTELPKKLGLTMNQLYQIRGSKGGYKKAIIISEKNLETISEVIPEVRRLMQQNGLQKRQEKNEK